MPGLPEQAQAVFLTTNSGLNWNNIPKPGNNTLKVYDITGSEVRTIIDDLGLNRGTVTYQFYGSGLRQLSIFIHFMLIAGGFDSKNDTGQVSFLLQFY